MRTLLATAVLVLATSAASADTPAPRTVDATKMASDDCARARKQNKTCVLDMKGDDIEGAAPTAGGIAVNAIKFGTHESLIRVRRDFIVEILKSAEDID